LYEEGHSEEGHSFPIIPISEKEILKTENLTANTEQPSSQNQNHSRACAGDVDLDSPVTEFCQNAYRKNGRRGKGLPKNLAASAQRGLVQRIEEAESSVGPDEFRRGLQYFLQQESDWTAANGWPIQAYLKDPSKWLRDDDYQPAENREPAGRHAIARPAEASPEPTPPPSARPGAFDAVTIWNEIVAFGTMNYAASPDRFTQQFAKTLQNDPDLTEALFRAVCAKCRKILTAKPEMASWLKFAWLAKVKDGMPGWAKVLQGDYDWALRDAEKAAAPSDKTPSALDRMTERAMANLEAYRAEQRKLVEEEKRCQKN
jgi:hypothetical protein